jgi:hypothetical protein
MMRSVIGLQTATQLWLLNVHRTNDTKQTYIHTTEPLVPEPSAFEVEFCIEMLISHKSPDIDEILAELINAICRTIRHEIHKLIISIRTRRNCLGNGGSRSLYLSIRRAIKETVVVIGAYHFFQLLPKLYPAYCC